MLLDHLPFEWQRVEIVSTVSGSVEREDFQHQALGDAFMVIQFDCVGMQSAAAAAAAASGSSDPSSGKNTTR